MLFSFNRKNRKIGKLKKFISLDSVSTHSMVSRKKEFIYSSRVHSCKEIIQVV